MSGLKAILRIAYSNQKMEYEKAKCLVVLLKKTIDEIWLLFQNNDVTQLGDFLISSSFLLLNEYATTPTTFPKSKQKQTNKQKNCRAG